MRRILIALLLACVQVSQAQQQPSLTARWEGSALQVEWSGAPDGSCLYLNDVFVDLLCSTSGATLLRRTGVDSAYQPRPGDVVTLRDERGQHDAARVIVPLFETILTLVVN